MHRIVDVVNLYFDTSMFSDFLAIRIVCEHYTILGNSPLGFIQVKRVSHKKRMEKNSVIFSVHKQIFVTQKHILRIKKEH